MQTWSIYRNNSQYYEDVMQVTYR